MDWEKIVFEKVNRELLDFLDKSPTSFHAVANMGAMLENAGYEHLLEGRPWQLKSGQGYYVTRNNSALIAFRIPKPDFMGFQIMASHSDSPALKIKDNAEIQVEKKYVKLNVEKYGGLLCSPWLDRPLSVAGRVVVRTMKGVEERLVHVDRDLLVIPNLAIHLNRKVNEGYEFNAQRDLLPLFGDGEAANGFRSLIAGEAGVEEKDLLDMDLFLYNRMKGTVLGLNGEFIAAPHLDDLQCAFASLKGFLDAKPVKSAAVFCVLDNEEVGSGTKQGADSTFLRDVLHRINGALGRTQEEYLMALTSSFMVSADNAHSIHPNQPDKGDPTNRPFMNDGIVIKYSANQKYTTDAVSGALFKSICERAKVPYQVFFNRSDMLGGSTLGNISNSQVALNTVDIGLPQLAMHSCYETAGSKDTLYLAEAAKVFYSSAVYGEGDGTYQIL
ncbi:MAG: M18 family aminopeptidase [Lachnospiraceae bacterium]|jgi:aspartyl aminopeptidase|nr:M18 family aminopeptidase [Lachnospiraceae bacterium]